MLDFRSPIDRDHLRWTSSAAKLYLMTNSKTTETETKLISINAALTERGARLSALDSGRCGALTIVDNVWRSATYTDGLRGALKAQIRDLEKEKHALLQELPL